MVFNRGEECTKDEKEYYNTIGKYTLILSIGYAISLILYLFIDDPIYRNIILYISIVLLTLVNIGYTLFKVKIVNIFSYLSIVLIVSCLVYSIIFFIFIYFIGKDKEVNYLEYPFYISFTINIILLFLFWLFGPCEKIYHDCNVESWPDEFKTDALKSGREDFCNNLNETCMNDKNKSEDECGTCSDSKYNNKEDCNDNDGEWTSRYTKCFWSKPSDKKVTSCDITTDSTPLEFHEGSCVYDLDKCASINCNDFQPTTVFYDCCEENTRGWQENMDCDTLRSQIDANKTFHDRLRTCEALLLEEEQDETKQRTACEGGSSGAGSCHYISDGLPGEKCVPNTNQGRIGGSGATQRAGELEAEYNLRVAASSQTSNIHDQDLYE